MGCGPSRVIAFPPAKGTKTDDSVGLTKPRTAELWLYEGETTLKGKVVERHQVHAIFKPDLNEITFDSVVTEQASVGAEHSTRCPNFPKKLSWEETTSTLCGDSWSGVCRGAGGVLKLTSQDEGVEYVLELVPQPFPYHFAVGGHAEESSGLAAKLVQQFELLCRPGRRVRFWLSNKHGSEEQRREGIANSANYVLILTPNVWGSQTVMSDLHLADQLNKNLLLVYMHSSDVPYVPVHPTPYSPFVMDNVQVNFGEILEQAPKKMQTALRQVEAIAYRSHPYMEKATLRHIAQVGGCAANLYQESIPTELLAVPDEAECAQKEGVVDLALPSIHIQNYEGVAITNVNHARHMRGWLQAMVVFDRINGKIVLEVSYAPQNYVGENTTTPYSKRRIELDWDVSSGEAKQTNEVLRNLGPKWSGNVGGAGTALVFTEGRDTIILKPLPFLWHYYCIGVASEAAAMANNISSMLRTVCLHARDPHVCHSFQLDKKDRAGTIAESAYIILFLSPSLWMDVDCLADLEVATKLNKPIIMVQDPDPMMPSHVSVKDSLAMAPGTYKHLFDDHDVLPYYRKWYEQDAFLRHLLNTSGFHDSIKFPQNKGEKVLDLMEQKSDLRELQVLKEGCWFYYEGRAERTETATIWGWYQVDVKFKRDEHLLEMYVDFISKDQSQRKDYNKLIKLDWDPDTNKVFERGSQQQWKGSVEGVGRAIHIQTALDDHLTFTPKPFIWHAFLCNVLRESAEFCNLVVHRLHMHCPPGLHFRTWYNDKPGAINKLAVALGVHHSACFILFVSPSTFDSIYVKSEIQVALELHKTIVVVYDDDPSSPCYVDLAQAQLQAPEEVRDVFNHARVQFPGPGGDLAEFTMQLMAAAGFGNMYRAKYRH